MNAGTLSQTAEWPTLGYEGRNSYRVSDTTVDMRRPRGSGRTARLPAQPQGLLIDVDRTALVVIDMQNDFCHPQGWVGAMGVPNRHLAALVEPINLASDAARRGGVPVIWVNWGVRPDRINLPPSAQHPFNPTGSGPGLGGETNGPAGPYNMLAKDSWGAGVLDELHQDPGDVRIDKQRISGFWDTPLDSILRNLSVQTLVFAGVNADHCVLGTLMDANFKGYDTILLEDCTATTSPDFCMQATLHNVRFCFGFTATAADWAGALAEG